MDAERRIGIADKGGVVTGVATICDTVIYATGRETLIFPRILDFYQTLSRYIPAINPQNSAETTAILSFALFPLIGISVAAIYNQLEPYTNKFVSKLKLSKESLKTCYSQSLNGISELKF